MKRSIGSRGFTMIAVATTVSAVIAADPTSAASPQEGATGMPSMAEQT